jgi:DNA-binding transcriptional regulator GbsR (MarR family)
MSKDVERFDERERMEAHRDSLYERMEEGYKRIETGLDQGEDVTTWEDFWLHLLNEYEKVCEALQRDLLA